MARSKRAPEPPDDDGEGNDTDQAATARDYVMARMAAARSCAQNAIDSIDEGVALFVAPGEDASGKKRTEAVEIALEQLGCATRAMESAEEAMPDVDTDEEEPWDE